MAEHDRPEYPGNELEIFAHAENWKAYWHQAVHPFLRGDVAEIGAGLGTNTRFLQANTTKRWVCVEPDSECFRVLKAEQAGGVIRAETELVQGTLRSLPANDRFDSIVYIDVVEHIEDDRGEMAAAAARLKPGGALIVLVPAYQALYCEFDRSIGHVRRYNLRMLRAIAPEGCTEVFAGHFDSVGLLASLANRLLLRHDVPSLRQIQAWDRWLVPASRVLDWLTRHTFGRSAVIVWRRNS